MANPGLSELVTERLGGADWIKEFDLIAGIKDFADDAEFRAQWRDVKAANKVRCRCGRLWCVALCWHVAGATKCVFISSTQPVCFFYPVLRARACTTIRCLSASSY
jgi:hypothetical protein